VTEGEEISLFVVLNFPAIRDVTVDINTSDGSATGENSIFVQQLVGL
jgi:hypothetical protein